MTPAERVVVKAALRWRILHDGSVSEYRTGGLKNVFAFRYEDGELMRAVDALTNSKRPARKPVKKAKKRK